MISYIESIGMRANNEKQQVRARSAVLMLLVAVVVAGCARDMSDLDSYMKDVRNKPAPNIEPIPTFQQYEAFLYGAAGLRSPFEKPQALAEIDLEGTDTGALTVKPDETRVKEYLEQYNISSMMMVGTVSKDGAMWGLVDDGNSNVHRVQVGMYLGRNHGKINYIDNSRIDVKEILPNGPAGWIERPKTLKLQEAIAE
jgi:type IV pilus assembly protein PilP